MIHVERESSKQSENLAAGWISRETFTPSNIRPSPIVARRKKEAGDRRAIVHGYFSQDPAGKGVGDDRKKAKTGGEFGRARKRRTSREDRVNRNERIGQHANYPYFLLYRR